MKKLSLTMIIVALSIFLSAAVVSAGGQHWRGFHGVYAMTATGSCLNSFVEFAPGDVVPENTPDAFSAKIVEDGKWTFELNGTGTFSGNRFGMTLPPFPGRSATPTFIEFDFSYKITRDGEIDIVVDPATFLATFLAGSSEDRSFYVDQYTMFGQLSSDHKTMTLTSGGFEVQKTTLPNGASLYGICNIGRVLIRVHD